MTNPKPEMRLEECVDCHGVGIREDGEEPCLLCSGKGERLVFYSKAWRDRIAPIVYAYIRGGTV